MSAADKWLPRAIVVSVFVAVMVLWLLLPQPKRTADPNAPPLPPDPGAMIADAEVFARRMLKDGESAKFRDLHIGQKPHMVCGQVNAKNSFGAFGGWQGMIYGAGIVFLEEHTTPDEWRKQWEMAC
jgi:hypothetical protein